MSFVLSSLRRTARLCPTTAANPPSTSDRPATELAGSSSHLGPTPSFIFPPQPWSSHPLPHDEAAGLFAVGHPDSWSVDAAPRFSTSGQRKEFFKNLHRHGDGARCYHGNVSLRHPGVKEDINKPGGRFCCGGSKHKKGERCHICSSFFLYVHVWVRLGLFTSCFLL